MFHPWPYQEFLSRIICFFLRDREFPNGLQLFESIDYFSFVSHRQNPKTCSYNPCFSLWINIINWKMNLSILAHPPGGWDNAGSSKCGRQARSKRQPNTAARTWATKAWPGSLECCFTQPTVCFQKTLLTPDSSLISFWLNTEANLGFIPSLPLNSLTNSSYSTNTGLFVILLFPQHTFGPLPSACCLTLRSFQSDWSNVPLTAWAGGPSARYSKYPLHFPDILLVCLSTGTQEWPLHSPSKFSKLFIEANLFISLMLTFSSNMPHFTKGNISWSEAAVYKLRQE